MGFLLFEPHCTRSLLYAKMALVGMMKTSNRITLSSSRAFIAYCFGGAMDSACCFGKARTNAKRKKLLRAF
jgi:hypothetical protein